MGPRHPRYFAEPYRECWPETYPLIFPWMQAVLAGGIKEVDDTQITLTRHGFPEEAYFTFTFSPLRDDTGAIAGILSRCSRSRRRCCPVGAPRLVRALAPRADSLLDDDGCRARSADREPE